VRPVVQNDEIVARSVHLGERNHPSGGRQRVVDVIVVSPSARLEQSARKGFLIFTLVLPFTDPLDSVARKTTEH
jgi:hypothetical protein